MPDYGDEIDGAELRRRLLAAAEMAEVLGFTSV